MLLVILAISAALIYYVVIPKMTARKMEAKMAQWHNTPKDLVIMHAIIRGRTVVHPSPFVVKLETFMRMAKIKYETDLGLKNAWGPKGRFPWISMNGEHLGDSELIIEFLKKKFEVNLNGKYTNRELAIGAAIRIMVDEHFFWAIPFYRFVYSSFQSLKSIMPSKANGLRIWLFKLYAGRAFSQRAEGHGIGLHSREEVEKLTMKDMKYLSEILRKNKFILGDEASEFDCTVFGHLSQAMWGLPGSIYEKAINDDFRNLKEYCLRMKETYWPDWDQLLQK